ncbi:MAG: A24 family peptidase [Rhodomicrobium sp.]
MIALTFATGAWAVSIAALFASAVTDLRERIIPNTIPLIIAACGLALSLQGGPWRIGMNVAAAITVFLALGFLAHYGFIGGGDVKLISAVTLLVPPERIGPLLIEIAIAGGLLS